MATTEEITITELELAEEILGDMVVAVDTTGDTKSVTLKQLRAWLGSSLPTGFILPAVGKISDERFALLDGRQLAKQGTFQAFCSKVESEVQAGNWFSCTDAEYEEDLTNYGQCGKFVIGQDYVRIPTITRFIGATITLSEIGKTYKESLPNIKGNSKFTQSTDRVADGCFERATEYEETTKGGGDINGIPTLFNAHLSSSTYQDGAKVQPEHTKYPYYMVVSTEGQTSPVEVDINQVFEDLLSKENTFNKVTNFDNPSDTTYPTTKAVDSRITDIMEIEQDGTEWSVKFNNGLLMQGGQVYGTSGLTLRTLRKPFKDVNYSLLASYGGEKNNHSNFAQITGLTVNKLSNTQFYSAIWGAKGNEIISWVALGFWK